MELSRLGMFLNLIAVISFARGQVDCPAFTANLLGSTTAAITTGLVRDAFAAITGETSSSAIAVQVHASNIVCLGSGRTRNTYSGVSVVVNYTCNGASNPACNGNPTISQFEFECVSSPLQWAASVGGSPDNIITTPPTGNFATSLRSDCGVCISPARSPFGTITNNEQHCGSCDPVCNNGLRMCFNRVISGCCSFYERDSCVASCTPPLVPNSSFDCVDDCPDLSITNGMVSYQPPGTPHFIDTTATYNCSTGYTLSENNVRTCQAVDNGMWSGSDPSCNPIDCGTLTDPANGMVDVSQGTTLGRVATYNCNAGYQLNGERTRTCEAGGWSGDAPTCETGGGMSSSSDPFAIAIIAIVVAAISLLTSIATVVIMMCIVLTFLRKCRHGGCLVGGAAKARNEMEMEQNVAYEATANHTSTLQDTTYNTVT